MNRRNEEVIKELIVKGHQAGLCDKEGNSLDINGHMVAAPSKQSGKTYVLRNGRLVEKGTYNGTDN